MTVTEDEKPKSGLPDGARPPTIDQLPDEDKWQHPDYKPDPVIHELTNQDFTETKAKMAEELSKDKPTEFLKAISEQAGKDLAYYAQFEKYDLEMDDGHTEKYYRTSPTAYEWDELEDLRAEVEGGEAMDDGHKLTKRETRLKTKLLEQLKAKYYLINVKTNKPMREEERAHVKNSGKIGAILDACVVVSLHKAVQGKK